MTSPLWPARLDHIVRESENPSGLADFYAQIFGLLVRAGECGEYLLEGRHRRLIIRKGLTAGQPMFAFRMTDAGHLNRMHGWCEANQLKPQNFKSPWFEHAFSVTDPEQRQVVFGAGAMPAEHSNGNPASPAAHLPGRLQHVVVASTNLPAMTHFYRDLIGFLISDNVVDKDSPDADITASFFRSDPEHHSFAAFRAPEIRGDHISFEVDNWNNIRDWADHVGDCHTKLWWGPGRHGPGNNLFFMIEDPDGYKLELSAELEVVPFEVSARDWRHEERTLNLWGNAWMRS